MSESKRHPLFDSESIHSRMRVSVRPDYKMRGYLHWLESRAIRLGLREPDAPTETGGEPLHQVQWLLTPLGGARSVTAAEEPFGPPTYPRVTDVVEASGVGYFSPQRSDHSCSLYLAREADGSRTVGLIAVHIPMMPKVRKPAPARAFLIEPEVRERIQEVVGRTCGVPPNQALNHAFTSEAIREHLELARLLAAIPDLDGESDGQVLRTTRLRVADTFERFPPRPAHLTVVIVFDHVTQTAPTPRQADADMLPA